MQRVAIARALVNDPDILLADEPTGALDSDTSIQVMELLKDVAKDRLVVMVTHNPDLAKQYATRRFEDNEQLLNEVINEVTIVFVVFFFVCLYFDFFSHDLFSLTYRIAYVSNYSIFRNSSCNVYRIEKAQKTNLCSENSSLPNLQRKH